MLSKKNKNDQLLGRGQKCPYSCLDSFLSLLFFRVLFFTKSTEVCRKPLLFFLSWSCDFCPWNWTKYLSICTCIQPGILCGVALKFYYHLRNCHIFYLGLSPVLGIISFLKNLTHQLPANVGGFSLYLQLLNRAWIGFCRVSQRWL